MFVKSLVTGRFWYINGCNGWNIKVALFKISNFDSLGVNIFYVLGQKFLNVLIVLNLLLSGKEKLSNDL